MGTKQRVRKNWTQQKKEESLDRLEQELKAEKARLKRIDVINWAIGIPIFVIWYFTSPGVSGWDWPFIAFALALGGIAFFVRRPHVKKIRGIEDEMVRLAQHRI